VCKFIHPEYYYDFLCKTDNIMFTEMMVNNMYQEINKNEYVNRAKIYKFILPEY
jgi:hypothetical protein